MKKKNNLSPISKLSNVTQIPLDATIKTPMIQMMSNREIVVEDAGKLIHYSTECIKVKQGKIIVCISGSCLKLKCLADSGLMVQGFLTSVSFE